MSDRMSGLKERLNGTSKGDDPGDTAPTGPNGLLSRMGRSRSDDTAGAAASGLDEAKTKRKGLNVTLKRDPAATKPEGKGLNITLKRDPAAAKPARSLPKPSRAAVIMVLAAGGVGFLINDYVTAPAAEERDTFSGEVAEVQADVDELEARIAAITSADGDSITTMFAQARAADELLPFGTDVSDVELALPQMLADSQLDVLSFSRGERGAASVTGLESVPFSLRVQATLDELSAFLDTVRTYPRLLGVRGLQFRPLTDSVFSGEVEATFVIEAFLSTSAPLSDTDPDEDVLAGIVDRSLVPGEDAVPVPLIIGQPGAVTATVPLDVTVLEADAPWAPSVPYTGAFFAALPGLDDYAPQLDAAVASLASPAVSVGSDAKIDTETNDHTSVTVLQFATPEAAGDAFTALVQPQPAGVASATPLDGREGLVRAFDTPELTGALVIAPAGDKVVLSYRTAETADAASTAAINNAVANL